MLWEDRGVSRGRPGQLAVSGERIPYVAALTSPVKVYDLNVVFPIIANLRAVVPHFDHKIRGPQVSMNNTLRCHNLKDLVKNPLDAYLVTNMSATLLKFI
jgi:hypothetical protein